MSASPQPQPSPVVGPGRCGSQDPAVPIVLGDPRYSPRAEGRGPCKALGAPAPSVGLNPPRNAQQWGLILLIWAGWDHPSPELLKASVEVARI